MGIDRWTYLGPYAELPLKLVTQRKDMCPTPNVCPNPTEGQFCSQCGMQVSKRFHEFQSADPPLADFLWKELNEAMLLADGNTDPQRISDDVVLYRILGNTKRPERPREFHLSNETMWLDLTEIDKDAEIVWFKRAFAPELMKIQATYGGMTYRWGFLQWYW